MVSFLVYYFVSCHLGILKDVLPKSLHLLWFHQNPLYKWYLFELQDGENSLKTAKEETDKKRRQWAKEYKDANPEAETKKE